MKDILNTIANNPIYISIGILATLSFLFGIYGVIIFAIKGGWSVLSVLLKLGSGLAKSKIAIFASGNELIYLKKLLLNSRLFSQKNIIEIPGLKAISNKEKASLYLVFWHDWQNEFDNILQNKKDKVPVIVYAPPEYEDISEEQMKKLSNIRNITVARFRGRLLSDIFFSLITGS